MPSLILGGCLALILGFYRFFTGHDPLDDPWDECSDLQGSPRTPSLATSMIVNSHDGEIRDV